MSLGTILYSNFVLGTIEMHWMLASFIMKVFSPCDYWSQALIINKVSSSSSSMYLGNKYLPHTYFLVSTLRRLLPGIKAHIRNCGGFALFSSLGISLWYLWWNCKNLFFNWYFFYTCCLSQSISTISCSLSDMRDVFDIF